MIIWHKIVLVVGVLAIWGLFTMYVNRIWQKPITRENINTGIILTTPDYCTIESEGNSITILREGAEKELKSWMKEHAKYK